MAYSDPVVQKYIDLIKSKNGKIKAYFQGEPTRIASSILPCCVVSKVKTEVLAEDNAYDRHEIGLRITIITDIRQDLSTDESHAKLVEGISTLYDIMEGRNSDYTVKDDSMLAIIRNNLEADAAHSLFTDLDKPTQIAYGLAKRDTKTVTVEGRLDFHATLIQTS